eukprot:scaffold618_cov372-Prasinococcus_capsulatus_cf.AAC.10
MVTRGAALLLPLACSTRCPLAATSVAASSAGTASSAAPLDSTEGGASCAKGLGSVLLVAVGGGVGFEPPSCSVSLLKVDSSAPAHRRPARLRKLRRQWSGEP